MPKETSAKPKRQRILLDKPLWPIFIEACGGVCCHCKRPISETGPLEKGHIYSHAVGGVVELENLMPLCESCNGRNHKLVNMPDDRAPAWRSNFLKLLAYTLQVRMVPKKVSVPLPKSGEGQYTLNRENSIETKQVISWDDVAFETDSALRTPLLEGVTTLPLGEVLAAMHELISAGNKHPVSLGPPDEKCQDRLKRLIQRHGRKDFMAAGNEFLLQGQWFDEDERGYRRRVQGWSEPWSKFADGFVIYLELAKEREARRVKEEAKAREAEANRLAAVADRQARDSWARYLSVRDLNWPTMTDADREFITAVQGTLENVQSVSNEDLDRAADILQREWDYRKKTKKYELLRTFDTLAKRVIAGELRLTRKASAELGSLRKLVEAASDNGPELKEYLKRASDCTKKGVIRSEPETEPEE